MEATEAGPGPARRRLLGRRLLLAALAIALLWSAGALLVPRWVAAQLRDAAQAELGRGLSIGRVAWNPWTLELTLEDVALAAAGPGAPPQLEVKRIHADAAIGSLLRLAPVLDAVDIDAPMLRLARTGEGTSDVDDVLARLARRPARPDTDAGPARFALHNIVVRGGSADLEDRVAKQLHRVRDLELGVPFVSSLPSQREITVEPHLAFSLDGTRFDSTAEATPFSERGNGVATLKIEAFDAAPWLAYLPGELAARPRAATLRSELRLAFEQRPRVSLRISGQVGVAGLKVEDRQSKALVDVGDIAVAIDELRPLEKVARLRRIEVQAPHLRATRDAGGRVDLLLVAETPQGRTQPVATVPLPTASTAPPSTSSPRLSARTSSSAVSALTTAASTPASAWTASLGELAVRAGRLDWDDTQARVTARIADFSLDASAIGWPLEAPVVFRGQGRIAAGDGEGRFAFSGQGNGKAAKLRLEADSLPLAGFAPYGRDVLAPALAGLLDADLEADWRAGQELQVAVAAKKLAVRQFRLGDARNPEAAADALELQGLALDVARRRVEIGRLSLVAPRLRVARDKERRWNVERWRAAAEEAAPSPSRGASAPASPAERAPTSTADRPWQLAVGELELTKGRVSFLDEALSRTIALDVFDLGLRARDYALAAERAPLALSARFVVPQAAGFRTAGLAGSLEAHGELTRFASGVPGAAQVDIVAKDLPLHLLDPYLDDLLNIDLQRAQTGFRGRVGYEKQAGGSALRVAGDATVDEFRATGTADERGAPQRALALAPADGGGRTLLSWKTLSLRGIELRTAPAAALRLQVRETSLSDFFARVLLDENGRLNLQDVVKGGGTAAAPPPPASGASAPAVGVAVAAAAPAPASGPRPVVAFGPVSVAGGRVIFNDRFVKPNYTANLTELAGRLAAFSTEPRAPGAPPELADLALTGRVEGTATLEVQGKVNPLARPLALDLKAKVRELELPPLSPYAVKYAGYGIERGKLSVDLAYVVQPNGQLTASNRIVLNQLAFGDKVEGAPASLPVKLAVALLADRNGVIDLDLPIGGSINDPQFSIGGIVWQAVKNIVVKALTSPFTLLASAFGGSGAGDGGALSKIEFAPGTATLQPAAREALDGVAKGLEARPALSVTLAGESRLDAERDAWKQERLRGFVRGEKRRQQIAAGATAEAEATVGDAEYPALLKAVYARADIAKPTNALGLAKDVPEAEMQALLLASITLPDDAMQQLAVRRAVVARDYLVAKGVPTARLFLGTPKTGAAGDAAWTPRVDLQLQAR